MKKIYIKNVLLIGLPLLIILLYLTLTFVFPNKEKAFLKKYGLDNKTIEQMVLKLEQDLNEPEFFQAVITGKYFIINDKGGRFVYEVPQFYLSIAPYINTTHPCDNHNLVTCRGELKNETFYITVKDSLGNTLIDGEYTSYENGFLGLWLPKDITGTITVTYQGLTATNEITTYSTSGTCLTTLQLQ